MNIINKLDYNTLNKEFEQTLTFGDGLSTTDYHYKDKYFPSNT